MHQILDYVASVCACICCMLLCIVCANINYTVSKLVVYIDRNFGTFGFYSTENQLKLSIILFPRLGTSGLYLTETSRATLMAASPCKS